MSKLRIMDHFKPAEDRLCCNLCPKSYPKNTYTSLWYLLKTKHAIDRPIWSDVSQIPPAKRTKVQSSFFSYATDGRMCQSMVYAVLEAVDCLSFYQQCHPESITMQQNNCLFQSPFLLSHSTRALVSISLSSLISLLCFKPCLSLILNKVF